MRNYDIIFLTQHKFTSELVEKLCKNNDLLCYTLNDLESFSFNYEDLKPKLVAVTQDFIESTPESENIFKNLDSKKLIFSTTKKDSFQYHLDFPIDTFNLIDNLKSILREC